MGEIKQAFDSVYRDFTTDGVASSGVNEPPKASIRELGALIETALSAASGDILRFATVAEMGAMTTAPAGKVAQVWNNNGSASDPANGAYQWTGSAWESAPWYFDAVAGVVQPMLDDAEAAATESQAWSEGTAPGGLGTKSAKEWAEEFKGSTGITSGWIDPFFRRAEIGEPLLDRQRWRSSNSNGFASFSLVDNPNFVGRALRKTGGGTANQAGPLIWFDELGLEPGDTFTVSMLVQGVVGRDCYGFVGFYTAANAASGARIAGTDAAMVRDSGAAGIILSALPQRLHFTGVVPAGAAAVAVFPYSLTMGGAETFDVSAFWASPGAGADWPFGVDTYGDTAFPKWATEKIIANTAATAGFAGSIDTLTRTGAGRGLYQLKQALCNPFNQFVGLALLGDSITWGMTVTGQAAMDPRTGSLADPRNNGSSPSWANLFHKHLGLTYFDDDTAIETGWAGSPSGVCQFEYNKTVNLFPNADNGFTLIQLGPGAAAWAESAAASSTYGWQMQAQVGLGTDAFRMQWRMTGYEFDIMFASIANGARYELFVDGVSEGIFTTNSTDLGLPVQYGNVRTHAFSAGFVRDALVEIRVIAGDAARFIFRAEAIRINRKLRVTNQGVIGATTLSYYNNHLANAVREDDSFAFVMLGTNDRAASKAFGAYESPSQVRNYYNKIVDNLRGRDVTPILAVTGAVTNNSLPTYKYTMTDVRAAIKAVADEKGCDFVDHFTPTRALIAAGDTTWLADGLHPNDTGHVDMNGRESAAVDNARAN